MPRRIDNQVVVITGAASGIGRVTARMFAERGARVVVGARNLDALNDLVREITEIGGLAYAVETDVTRREDVEQLAQTALNYFGRLDTWVNNAGVSVYAMFDKLSDEEIRRIMDVNFMGTVHGLQAALPILRSNGGGTVINVASVTGKRAIPLQSVYSASKYAVIGLSEALRAELAYEDSKINVCTICPPSINTPFFDNALTKEGYAPKPVFPVYEPEAVAKAIISCAENPQREVLVGAGGKMFAVMNTLAPGLTDWVMGKVAVTGQLSNEPEPKDAPNNLFEPTRDSRERGEWSVWGTRRQKAIASGSLIERHPVALSAAGVVALIVAARYLLR
ncbi:MAG TPA: SDR family oxidoreductase [Blastocatellia bacterium]|nr:SDR family oxidoreductase [Blastocatellia bacterium]